MPEATTPQPERRRKLRKAFATDRHDAEMTNIDFEDGLELLREHDIRVVSARIVDSPEDAIAFADRRPIELGLLESGADSTPKNFETDLQTTDRIRHAYGRLEKGKASQPPTRILARRQIETGTDIAIEARDDAVLGRIVEIRGGGHTANRLVPLGEDQAESMLAEFHAKHGIASGEARTRMLAHVLLRVSEIFADDAIVRMSLDPVRIADNAYDVVAAHIVARRPLTLRRRLAKDAHDRKGYLAPSGR